MRYLDMNTIRRIYRGANPTGCWFDSDTLRWHNSRLSHYGWAADDGTIFFVSSEKQSASYYNNERHTYARMYTVRAMCARTGVIDAVGEFQQYRSRTQAHNACERAAKAACGPMDPQTTTALRYV